MPFYFCQWNDKLIEYISLHGITPEDFEQVVCYPKSIEKSSSTGREIAFGWTRDGEYVACVYEWLDKDSILPITAYPVED